MTWFSRHAPAIEAGAALVTALVAVAALVGIKVQLDSADALQRAQSAREAYRGHLALAVNTPEFAAPAQACALIGSDRGAAYGAFVDHLLYSAEQMLQVTPGWSDAFRAEFVPHRVYLCSHTNPADYEAELAALLVQFQSETCAVTPDCGD